MTKAGPNAHRSMAIRWSTHSGQGSSPWPNWTAKAPSSTPQTASTLTCATQNPRRLMPGPPSSEVQRQRAGDVVTEQQQGRRQRGEEQGRRQPPPARPRGQQRAQDQQEDDRVHADFLRARLTGTYGTPALSCLGRAAQKPLDFLPERLPLLPLGLGEVGQRRRVADAGQAGEPAKGFEHLPGG